MQTYRCIHGCLNTSRSVIRFDGAGVSMPVINSVSVPCHRASQLNEERECGTPLTQHVPPEAIPWILVKTLARDVALVLVAVFRRFVPRCIYIKRRMRSGYVEEVWINARRTSCEECEKDDTNPPDVNGLCGIWCFEA